MHIKISARSLAANTLIYPMQCRKLIVRANSWNRVQKVEISLVYNKVAKEQQNKVADKLWKSNNVWIQNWRDSDEEKKHPTKHKQLANSLEILESIYIDLQTRGHVHTKDGEY